MADKLKVMIMIGTRPEIIRLSSCIKACDKYFNTVLVHTGQNWDYTLYEAIFKDLKLREPDYYLDSVGKTLGDTMGNIISKSYNVMEKERPDALLVLGDTNSALTAISAKRLKIPIFHMEAGNRCFDENVPEEINRKIIDHVADVSLAYTEHSRRNLLSEGFNKERLFVVGSPMAEVFRENSDAIDDSKVLQSLNLEPDSYILLSAHREENIDNEENFLSLMSAVNDIAETYKKVIIYSVHPRAAKFIEKRNFKFSPLVRPMKPFGFLDYNKLQQSSFCVLSDSGSLSEESALLGFLGILLRTSTEHMEVLDKGSIILGGITSKDIKQAMELAFSMKSNNEVSCVAPDYDDDNVSAKVVKIIQSYTKIINEFTWRK